MSSDLEAVAALRAEAHKEIAAIASLDQLQAFNDKFFDKEGKLSKLLAEIKQVSDPEEKRKFGQQVNTLKTDLNTQIEKVKADLQKAEEQAQLNSQFTDITGAVNKLPKGGLHPITKERQLIEDIFISMGFEVWEPRIVDDEYHNFTSLNVPENHPAKDMWDTIWTESGNYLITHTSSMQHRIIKGTNPPIRAIVPGRCFRNEATDRTHEHSFFQVEGVYVDKGIKLSDMFGTIQQFLNSYYQIEVPIKIQPTFFPFVEPGIEIMVNFGAIQKALGRKVDSALNEKWIELIPCGPIHPFVIKEAGLDPDTYSGFAWGFGLDRLIMVKYGIDDIRLIHSGRLDFINQFN